MKQKLDKIMLIDDSKSDNFIHARRIRKHGTAEEIVIKYSGAEALEYLSTPVDDVYPAPDLIFLDINMPGMSGWEFLDEYHKLPEEQKGKIILTMLTTSVAAIDRKKAEAHDDISGFEEKPITSEMLDRIIEKYFPDHI